MTILLYPENWLSKDWSIKRDGEFFLRLVYTVKNNVKRNLIWLAGLIIALTATLLSFEVRIINIWVWGAIVEAVVVTLSVLLVDRPRVWVRDAPHPKDFDPVSLGTLWFSFAMSLWIGQTTETWYFIPVEILFSAGALIFLVAVFSRSVRWLLNTKATLLVLILTGLAFVGSFILGWLPALSKGSEIIKDSIAYFGFFWIIVMLLVMLRDFKNELARLIFISFFLVGGFIKIFQYGPVDVIGGFLLIGIAILSYLLATGRLHPYGEVTG